MSLPTHQANSWAYTQNRRKRPQEPQHAVDRSRGDETRVGRSRSRQIRLVLCRQSRSRRSLRTASSGIRLEVMTILKVVAIWVI